MRGVDGGVGSFDPAGDVHVVENGLQGGFRALANAGALVRGKNGKEDSILCQDVQGFEVHRGF